MSDDIVERLRFYAVTPLYGDIPQWAFGEAANEIERLRAENKKQRNKIASLKGMIEDEEELDK